MTRAAREGGFSLVETLVALAVIAAMAGMLFQSIAVSARLSAATERRREAAMLAQSLLDRSVVTDAWGASGESGRWRDLRWRVASRTAEAGARDSGPALTEVRVEVLDGDTGRRLAQVRTLRLGAP